jgi:hypothetical protein
MAILIKKLSICVVLMVTFLVAGCASNTIYKVPDVSLKNQGREYIVDTKIDLAVNLWITGDLMSTQWQRISGDGKYFLIPIGNQLAKNSIEVSDLLFKDVVVVNTSSSKGTGQAQAILTPRVVEIERSLGGDAFSESIFIIVLEWKLEDNQGNTIWIDSIKGEGRAEIGNIYNHKKKAAEQIEILLKDLFSKSFQAMKASPEITRFVAKKQPQ